MKWRLREYTIRCEQCKHLFNSFGSAGDFMPYGTFYMYARNGDIAIWEAVTDKVFSECTDLIHALLPVDMPIEQKRERDWSVRGICCDPAADGSTYQHYPYCPVCGDSLTRLNVYADPPHYEMMNLPEVKHHRWNALSKTQREQVVRDELKRKKLI
ncbi:MAG: hypothetical protein U0694_13130 [Anaerolineae bacterium]